MADNSLFDVDSEIVVLSTILKVPALVHSTDGLRCNMFSASPHQVLFDEFEQLREGGLLPDPQLVISSLESKKKLDAVGGKHYIETLLKREAHEESFKKFVEIVIASYKARSYLSLMASEKKNDLNADNITERINATRLSLESLISVGGGSSTVHVSEITKATFDEIIARLDKPGIRGVSWGVDTIDKATGGKSPGDLIIIAARPGIGKTSVICNSVLSDAKAGVASLLISREMRPQELMERLISIETGIPSPNIRLGILNQEQVDKVYACLSYIKTLPIYLDYNFRISDILYLESTVSKYKKQHDIGVTYLDYIQIATERDENQTMEIGRLTRKFKALSNDLGICSVLISQLNRGVESRDDKRPLLSDMRQSGAIEEDADFVIGLYRDEHYNKETKAKGLMEYIILKHRNGPPGTVVVKFDGPTYRITEA